MDPNVMLARLLELARKYTQGEGMTIDDAIEMAMTFEALDDWFRRGGYLPLAWADKIKPRPLLVKSDDP